MLASSWEPILSPVRLKSTSSLKDVKDAKHSKGGRKVEERRRLPRLHSSLAIALGITRAFLSAVLGPAGGPTTRVLMVRRTVIGSVYEYLVLERNGEEGGRMS